MNAWLAHNTRHYPAAHLLVPHVDNALAAYPLRPKTDVYTYDDGRTILLLCLHGLLPIAFKGATYNIPVALWVPLDYPKDPPIVYVVPTHDMLIKPSSHVQLSGRCDLDYLHDWIRKPEAANLVQLLQHMQAHFSAHPPLYARPKPKQQPPPPPPPPPPPLPLTLPNLLDNDTPVPPPPSSTPQRPPNPELLALHTRVHEKLTTSLRAFLASHAIDSDKQRRMQADLLNGQPAIRDEMARLQAVTDVCRAVSTRLSATVQAVQANVSELRLKGDPEIDELVCASSIVHNQLINLVAEDNAIEDTIYHLHRALNAGRIDLERFLRTSRVLAEEQFTKRALLQKILNGV